MDKNTKIIFTILVVAVLLCLGAMLVNASGFILSGNKTDGWILITPNEDYYARWIKDELWAVWINHKTNLIDCTVIRGGKDYPCTLSDVSIILSYYPVDKINKLKQQ